MKTIIKVTVEKYDPSSGVLIDKTVTTTEETQIFEEDIPPYKKTEGYHEKGVKDFNGPWWQQFKTLS